MMNQKATNKNVSRKSISLVVLRFDVAKLVKVIGFTSISVKKNSFALPFFRSGCRSSPVDDWYVDDGFRFTRALHTDVAAGQFIGFAEHEI